MLSGMTTTAELGGTLRWMSPELIDGDTVSAKSDVWAYAMTVLASSMSGSRFLFMYLTRTPRRSCQAMSHTTKRRTTYKWY